MNPGKIKASPEVIASDLGDGAALFDMRSGVYFDLNQSGSFVWGLLDQPRTVPDLATELARVCEIDLETSMADTNALIKELLSHNLVLRCDGE
jgi:hypothetical protein